MTTRYSIKNRLKFGVSGISSGYDSSLKGSDLTIPSCGIEDIDRSLFNLFDKEIPLSVSTDSGLKKVPVIVAGGERWALLKKNRGIRDDNGSLILPLVTIVKTQLTQTYSEDITGRGVNQSVGRLTIKRRFDGRDRSYQALINKRLIENQKNIPAQDGIDNKITSTRSQGFLLNDPTTGDGAWLSQNNTHNIYEILSVPTPQFITLNYSIMLWTQYQLQMNQLIETIMSSYLPQMRGWITTTDNGYWFPAIVSSDEFASEDNVSDMQQDERMVRRKFDISIKGFLFATKTPGAPIPVSRHISNPSVSFGLSISDGSVGIGSDVVEEPYLGDDDPTLPRALKTRRKDQRYVGESGKLYPYSNANNTEDPALGSLRRGAKKSLWRKIKYRDSQGNVFEKFLKIKSYNKHTGEMVLTDTSFDLGGITILSVDD